MYHGFRWVFFYPLQYIYPNYLVGSHILLGVTKFKKLIQIDVFITWTTSCIAQSWLFLQFLGDRHCSSSDPKGYTVQFYGIQIYHWRKQIFAKWLKFYSSRKICKNSYLRKLISQKQIFVKVNIKD